MYACSTNETDYLEILEISLQNQKKYSLSTGMRESTNNKIQLVKIINIYIALLFEVTLSFLHFIRNVSNKVPVEGIIRQG